MTDNNKPMCYRSQFVESNIHPDSWCMTRCKFHKSCIHGTDDEYKDVKFCTSTCNQCISISTISCGQIFICLIDKIEVVPIQLDTIIHTSNCHRNTKDIEETLSRIDLSEVDIYLCSCDTCVDNGGGCYHIIPKGYVAPNECTNPDEFNNDEDCQCHCNWEQIGKKEFGKCFEKY